MSAKKVRHFFQANSAAHASPAQPATTVAASE
jgi:hypothetical protein